VEGAERAVRAEAVAHIDEFRVVEGGS